MYSFKSSAYGISDRLVDAYVPIAIFCGLATTVALCVLKPQSWYLWLFLGAFAAWYGPIIILMSVFCIECLIYGILHPKASYKTVLEFVAFFALIAGSMAFAVGTTRCCASRFASPDTSTWEFAYVSESPNARCYHYSEQCKALRRTTYEIETLSVDEAEDYDYEPCSLCLKESVREKWDDAAGVIFIPVSCLLFGLVNKIGRFRKKYKFRNPIVKK